MSDNLLQPGTAASAAAAGPRDTGLLVARTREELLRRNRVVDAFFAREAPRLARACEEMARRFLAGGRLIAFGRGAATTDAQHVSVEFVHPVIVGKRALPAMDLGPEFEGRVPAVVRPDDMVMGFAFGPDTAVRRALEVARGAGAMTFALAADEDTLAGRDGRGPETLSASNHLTFAPPDADPFVCQEVVEILYHVLWETVHVYFEHREQGHDVGASSFLYPFLGRQEQRLDTVVEEVQGSMRQKAAEVNAIRAELAEQAGTIVEVACAVRARLIRGGTVIAFGNGGSATDANDLVIDCLAPPPGLAPIPAVSLSAEAANITAVANDIGSEQIFARQLIAHARPEDIAIGISTSGSSPNIMAALAEARKRGLLTVGIAGYDGGKVAGERLADHVLVARSDYVPRIQEAQASAYHVLLRRLQDLRGLDGHA